MQSSHIYEKWSWKISRNVKSLPKALFIKYQIKQMVSTLLSNVLYDLIKNDVFYLIQSCVILGHENRSHIPNYSSIDHSEWRNVNIKYLISSSGNRIHNRRVYSHTLVSQLASPSYGSSLYLCIKILYKWEIAITLNNFC